jgi:predicted nuclease of predicted toxin-antitoxin system
MRLLANENFPMDAVVALQGQGHDVSWVRLIAPGSSNPEVLALAQAEVRILLTFDKDFGELAFRYRLPASCGIVLFRISLVSSEQIARLAVAALDSRSDWAGNFSVIEEQQIRMTPIPFVR